MRYLVVGYGNIGHRRARLLGDRCVGTVDPVALDAVYRTVDQVPAARYDAVVLGTPNRDKLGYLHHFLALGKPVLVEKPLLFRSRAEAEALERRARGHAVWYTSYNHRFEPLVGRLRRLLRDGAIGELDRVRMRYGNGTVRHWRATWREAGAGVLEDLGCHLIDLCGFVLGRAAERYELLDLRRVESETFDYALFRSADRRVVLEVGSVFWKNTFAIEVYGSTGSLHLEGLNKWGGALLAHHRRVLPSGAPVEAREHTTGGDTTWETDLAVFESAVGHGQSSLENDCRIADAIQHLVAQEPALAEHSEIAS